MENGNQFLVTQKSQKTTRHRSRRVGCHAAAKLIAAHVISLLAFCALAAEPIRDQTDTRSGLLPTPSEGVSSGVLKRSDTPFSPRARESASRWQTPFEAFLSNRIVWTYAGPSIIPQAAQKSIPVQCAFEFWVPETQLEKEQMVCTNPRGGYGGFKTDATQAAGVYRRPDINSPAWRAYQLKSVQRLVTAGCMSFQQDVAWLNVHMLQADGCYSEASMSGFRDYLRRILSPAELASLGIRDVETFDHRTNQLPALKGQFADFQREATAQYHSWLHTEANNFAKRKLVFSGNIPLQQLRGGASVWLKPHFDFILSEMRASRTDMPNSLRAMGRLAGQFAGTPAVTFVTDDIWLNQRAIASTYALGMVAVAPWDIYIAPAASRFFGNPTDFSPLFFK